MFIMDINSAIYRFISKLCQFVLLNILWLIGCLPFFTIGASTAALYRVAGKLTRNEEGYLIKDYISAFRQNFYKATLTWLVMVSAGFVLLQDYRYLQHTESVILQVILLVLVIVFALTSSIVFPFVNYHEGQALRIFKASLVLAIRHLPSIALILLMNIIIGYGVFVSLPFMIFMLICGRSMIAFASTFLFNNIFEANQQRSSR